MLTEIAMLMTSWDMSSLKRELRKVRLQKPSSAQSPAAMPTQAAYPVNELALAEHLGASPDLADIIQAYLPLTMITDPLCRRFIEAVIQAHTEHEDLMSVLSRTDTDNRDFSTFAAKVLTAPSKTKTGREYSGRDAVESLILGLWRAELQRRCRNIEQQSLDSTNETDKDNLMAQAQQLTTDINRIQRWKTGEPILRLYMEATP